MSAPPKSKKILIESFNPDQKSWIKTLLSPLNKFMDDVSNALDKRLTLSENFDAEIKNVTVDNQYPLSLAWGRSSKPTIGYIGKIERVDGADVNLSSAITLIWSFNQEGEVVIQDIVGLDDSSSNKYRLNLVFHVK